MILNGYIYVETTDDDLYEIYYDGETGTIKIEYIGKKDKDKTLEETLKSYPKIDATYSEETGKITASATVENGTIEKMELIYKGSVIEKETKTENLGKEQTFDARQYGPGWYKIKVTASNGKWRNKWVKASNLDVSIKQPTIIIEPAEPNGDNGWYKRTKEEGKDTEIETKVKVTIQANNSDADCIYYTANRRT